jgi:ABC transport system ATP-binding/permease protein
MKQHDAPLITLTDIHLGFGGPPLIDHADLSIHEGERVCLVGRNGSGKSTLMKVMAGLVIPDDGEVMIPPSVRVTYLAQTPSLKEWPTALDAVKSGLTADRMEFEYLAESYLRELTVDPVRSTETMSGGECRKVALARALISDPHLLLLDEPTNHLDLPSIEWLEKTLGRLGGAIALISHDRALLERCTTRTLWIERGQVRQLNAGFSRFDVWREEVYHEEDLHKQRMDKLLAQETQWLREGISARRTRNQGRLRRLMKLREERTALRKRSGIAALNISSGERSGRVVIEASAISKSYGDRALFQPLDLRIMRGDRVGVIGANGAGKSTLINVICGDLAPDEGSVKLGTQLKPIYIDQNRTLDENATLMEVLCVSGSDRVMVHGRPVHVAGYLQDFLFEGRDARRKVKTLSGGERARLLLAQQLTESANLLILDEPTNDLDLETLELLQDLLGDYAGTVIMVSHDRDFLDKVVTSILAFEEDGKVIEYAGGYTDMLAQKASTLNHLEQNALKSTNLLTNQTSKRAKKKLSYKENKALETAQEDMERYGDLLDQLEREISDPSLFEKAPEDFQKKINQMGELRIKLEEAEEEWLRLEAIKEELEAQS